jgi:hypothetical protein
MIMGTAAATLTGLMFVATTLIAGLDTQMDTVNAGVAAFNTPTVVHFCTVLLMTAILSAPWQTFSGLRFLIGFLGLSGVFYLLIIFRRMRRVPNYQNTFEDWLWYLTLPLSAHIGLLFAAIELHLNPASALYIISAAMLLLLFVGIRNAWDMATFLAVERSHRDHTSRERRPGNKKDIQIK